ncbi:MAG: hypothetical protein KGD63_12355 [Candidatus Lokiarchaeota archaeon]|nr:hypothetical protein [Candidatus Lokiarchaeota archaeon]
MDFFKSLERIKKKKRALILYCLLNRIPIIVIGDSSLDIDEFIIDLSNLINFRKELVYYTDFISNLEYQDLIQNENNDYQTMRIQIRCPSNVAMKAISQLDTLNTIIIGLKHPKDETELILVKELIKIKTKEYLEIMIDPDDINVNMIGFNEKLINLDLEIGIFQKISEKTEKSINKMKRVLIDKINKSHLDRDLKESLLDFNLEKIEIKKNIFQAEIQDFYSGTKRAFYILSKLDFLNNIEINSIIGSKTFLEVIDYEEGSIQRILTFIEKEWGENFTDLIENNKLTFIGDKIQSFWG